MRCAARECTRPGLAWQRPATALPVPLANFRLAPARSSRNPVSPAAQGPTRRVQPWTAAGPALCALQGRSSPPSGWGAPITAPSARPGRIRLDWAWRAGARAPPAAQASTRRLWGARARVCACCVRLASTSRCSESRMQAAAWAVDRGHTKQDRELWVLPRALRASLALSRLCWAYLAPPIADFARPVPIRRATQRSHRAPVCCARQELIRQHLGLLAVCKAAASLAPPAHFKPGLGQPPPELAHCVLLGRFRRGVLEGLPRYVPCAPKEPTRPAWA